MLVFRRFFAFLGIICGLCIGPSAAAISETELADEQPATPSLRLQLQQASELGKQERYEEAQAMLVDLVEQFAESGDTLSHREALVELGLLLGRQGQVEEGAARLRQALPLADASVDRSAPIAVRLWLARLYLQNDRAIDALPWADAALLAALAANRSDFLAAPGEMYFRTATAIDGSDATLLSAVEHVESRFRGIPGFGGRDQFPLLVFTRGVEFLDGDDDLKALASMQLAVRLAQLQGTDENLASYLNGIGYVALDLGDLDTARDALERGLNLTDGRTVAMLSTLAIVAQRQGWLEESSSLTREAMELVQQQPQDVDALAALTSSLGRLSCAAGELNECRRLLEQAISLHEQGQDDAGLVTDRSTLALLAVQERRWEEAEGEALGSLSFNRNPLQTAGAAVSYLVPEAAADALLALAAVHHQRDEQDEARRELSQAASILARDGSVEDWVRCACSAGHLALAGGDTDGALEAFQTVAGVEEPGSSIWRAFHGLGLTHWQRGELEDAETALRESLATLASLETKTGRTDLTSRPFTAENTSPRGDLVRLLLEQQRADEAFVVAGGEIPGVASGTALLRFGAAAQQTVVWLVTTDGLQAIELPVPAQQLSQLADTLGLGDGGGRSPSRRRRGVEYETLQQLHDLLLAPVLPTLLDPGIETLFIQADGPIGRIPMEALFDGEQFLVERFAVVWVPAGASPAEGTPRPNRIRRAAIQGTDGSAGACGGVKRRFRNASLLSADPETTDLDLLCLDADLRVNPIYPDVSRLRAADGSNKPDPNLVDHQPAVVVLDVLPPGVQQDTAPPSESTSLALERLAGSVVAGGATAVVVPQLTSDDDTATSWLEAYCRALGRDPLGAARQAQLQMIRAGQTPAQWASWRVYGINR